MKNSIYTANTKNNNMILRVYIKEIQNLKIIFYAERDLTNAILQTIARVREVGGGE